MAEYIERKAALQFVFEACAECMDACEEFDGIYPDCNQCMLEGVKLKLRDVPAADVHPVRHGRWKPGDMPTYGGFKCSLCKKNTIVYKPPYCPNCGAKMDKEVGE